MLKNKAELKKRREVCQNAPIGSEIVCPSCGTAHIKKAYNTVFCKTKGGTVCKDNFWNNVDPKKRNNRTRISPGNKAYYNNVILPKKARELGFPDVESMKNHVDDFDGSWDAHGCHVEPCDFCGLRAEYCRCGEGEF
jgi:hypothetical protein